MVQCPCWSSCVQCSSQDPVPKCSGALTFMSAMPRSSIYTLMLITSAHSACGTCWQESAPRSAPPSCWGAAVGGEICAWTSMKFHWYFILHIRGLCGASSGQKAFAVRAGEVHVCLCPCGVSLLCADPCLYQQALAVCGIWWLPTSWLHTWAYGRDAAPCWQKCFGMWCMKRANRNVSVISCEERQMWVYIKTSQRACWQGQGEGEVGVSVLL